MAWNQLTCFTKQAEAENISDYLHELGALAVTFKEGGEDKIYEPMPGETPLWNDTQVVGLFDAELEIQLVIQLMTRKYPDTMASYQLEEIADQAWERAWLDEFKPMQFGANLWIIPSTYQPIDDKAVNIYLDPGLAFGTGTHATTAMCLAWLDANSPSNNTVIDYGCGSGILAIAAAKLGAVAVDAVDIDPQAIDATRTNAANNAVVQAINACLPEQFQDKLVDILLANILAKPLIGFAKTFAEWVKPEGKIVLSGILDAQADEVLCAYEPYFTMLRADSLDGWVLLSGSRKA